MTITASLVLYHNDPAQYGSAMSSYLEGCDGVLYVVDNSRSPLKHLLFSHPRVKYIFAGQNLGFGAGHNKAFSLLPPQSNVHLLLNPDVSFGPEVLLALIGRMQSEPDIGAIMPKILFPDGRPQHLCKLIPTPIDLIFRRFVPLKSVRNKSNRRYELHDLPRDRPSDVPFLSGCFLLIRTALLGQVGGFDPRYFMYMEDLDLVRRVGDVARTVYEPSISVVHAYAKGSYHNRKLLWYHVKSAIAYFNKWGWFFDPVRSERNSRTLAMIAERSA